MIASLLAQHRAKLEKGPTASRSTTIKIGETRDSEPERSLSTQKSSQRMPTQFRQPSRRGWPGQHTECKEEPSPSKPVKPLSEPVKPICNSVQRRQHTNKKRSRRPDMAERFGGWCEDCKSGEDVIQDSRGGRLVCTNCGLVVNNKLISDEAEWRNFSESDRRGADPNRVGGGYDELLGAGANMLTLVGDDCRLAMLQKHQFTSEERKMMQAYDIIKKFTAKLTLPQDVGHCAQELYKQIAETKSMTGKKNLTVCATVLYIAAKAGRNARPIRELCEILSVKRKQVSKCYSVIMKLRSEGKLKLRQQRTTTVRQPASATQEYAVRFANKLRLPGAIVTGSRLIVKKVEELAIMTGKQPGTIASACVYLASSLHPNKRYHRTFKEIGLMAQVTDNTIQAAYRKFILPNRARLVDRSIQYASGVRPKKKDSLF